MQQIRKDLSSSLTQLPSLWSLKHHHENLNLKPQLPSPRSLEIGPLEDGQFCKKSWILASQVGVGSHKEVLSQSMFPCFILLYKNSGRVAPWCCRNLVGTISSCTSVTGFQPLIRCPYKTGMWLIPSLPLSS